MAGSPLAAQLASSNDVIFVGLAGKRILAMLSITRYEYQDSP